jgi:tetratricopeptide (TPR) repeat protein
VRITSEGGRIVVRDGSESWHPESGQLLLDFHVADLAARAVPLARRLAWRARRSDEPLTADQWYDLGADLETVAPEEAREAYARAVALEPGHASARVNLGRLLQHAGRPADAVEHYRRALAAQPGHPMAAFNLGTALQAYRKALEADRDFADAHFNLARLYEQAGRRAAALRHLRAYQELTR